MPNGTLLIFYQEDNIIWHTKLHEHRKSRKLSSCLIKTENVIDSIDIDIDADAVCTAFRKKQTEVIDAERRLKEIRKNGVETDLECAYEAYGNAVIAIFELIFGEDGTKKLLEFFEDNYIEMGIQVVPFINAVIVPKINETLRNRKAQIRALHKYR